MAKKPSKKRKPGILASAASMAWRGIAQQQKANMALAGGENRERRKRVK